MQSPLVGNPIEDAVRAAMNIDGWMNPEELLWLATQASRCNIVIEFGSWKGRSTKALTTCHGSVVAIDTFEGYIPGVASEWDQALAFARNLDEELRRGKVTAIPVRTIQAPLYCRHHTDMVFLDAAHDYKSVCQDIEIAKYLLRGRGLLCGHDFSDDYPGVKRAVTELVPGFERAPGGDIWFKVL